MVYVLLVGTIFKNVQILNSFYSFIGMRIIYFHMQCLLYSVVCILCNFPKQIVDQGFSLLKHV